ncbi:MAG: hypothetical protein ABJA82_11175, partial [Myxococcales bacterium]
ADPDGDNVTVEWAVMKVCAPDMPLVTDCTACDENASDYLIESNWPRPDQRVPRERYEVDRAFTDHDFCVWAFAVDSKGAVRPAIHRATPENRTPVAKIAVELLAQEGLLYNPLGPPSQKPPYPLYSVLKLSSKSTDADDDPLHADWTVMNPRGVLLPMLNICPDSNPPERSCFTAEVPGTYLVTLTIDDMMNQGVGKATLELPVADDRLPCIYDENVIPLISRQPLPGTFDQNLDLLVKVEDDGDWAPRTSGGTSIADFRWSVKKSGDESFHYLGDRYYTKYTVPATDYSLGDLVKVRLEFLDRNRTRIENILKSCADADDICGMTPTCHQRVTWTIQY